MRKTLILLVAVLLSALAACGAAEQPKPVIEDAWVRTTTDKEDPGMTGAFMSITNPGDDDISLVKAACEDAGMVQLHEMVKADDGKMVMQETKEIVVPAGGHQHLEPGGYHVMLMKLPAELKVGDEVTISLEFSDGYTTEVTAPVKEFTEETEHYHPSESPSAGSEG